MGYCIEYKVSLRLAFDLINNINDPVNNMDNKSKQEQALGYIQNARLMDDSFFELCFRDEPKYIENVINCIFKQLGIPEVKINEINTQKRYLTVGYRNACLDAVAKDANGNLINIEVQRARKHYLFRRARYHSSLLDTNNLTRGDKFYKLPDTYVIFILDYDLKKQGLPAYQVKRTFLEDNSDFDDGTRFIFVNGTYRGDDLIGELMNDFHAYNARQMKNALLKERVEFFKGTKKGRKAMKSIEQVIEDRAKAKGIAEGRVEIAKNLLKLGELSLESISAATGLTLKQVQYLQKSLLAPV